MSSRSLPIILGNEEIVLFIGQMLALFTGLTMLKNDSWKKLGLSAFLEIQSIIIRRHSMMMRNIFWGSTVCFSANSFYWLSLDESDVRSVVIYKTGVVLPAYCGGCLGITDAVSELTAVAAILRFSFPHTRGSTTKLAHTSLRALSLYVLVRNMLDTTQHLPF